MTVQGGMGKICLLGSPGPDFIVDEAVVVASWVEDGKRKVKLLGYEGKVFEVYKVVDIAASSVEGGGKKFKFKSSDGVVFEVDKALVMQSLTLRSFCLNCTDSIPVVKFNSEILDKKSWSTARSTPTATPRNSRTGMRISSRLTRPWLKTFWWLDTI
ncbi:hypothetical protein PAHAL_4G289300 [Panicum hallii]|uniref:SKP1 component POZ domain-containing protein n=1 Tax=Panicum hallii TaxID=206008 RepID=A0A2T8JEB8_9POAL|nr:hypothetical protein PAHAL_4G289300 [Panicum hallii]